MGKQDEHYRTQIRIPTELHEAIMGSVTVTGRSMNAEIVHRLRESIENTEKLNKGIHASSIEAFPEDITKLIDRGPDALEGHMITYLDWVRMAILATSHRRKLDGKDVNTA